jgi:hypothetical protein
MSHLDMVDAHLVGSAQLSIFWNISLSKLDNFDFLDVGLLHK